MIKEYRRLKLSPQITAKLKAYIQARSLDAGALLFARRAAPLTPLRAVTDPGTLGLTEPNEAGRQYRHGTLSAYTAGKCRCSHCRRVRGLPGPAPRGSGRSPTAKASSG